MSYTQGTLGRSRKRKTKGFKIEYVRKVVHYHNSFFGMAFMARRAMVSIQESTTATPETKALADKIESDLITLYDLLKTRVDPPDAFEERTPQ